MKASDIQVDKNISMLLKGPWGFGKTIAAASFALDGPVFLAYFDKAKPIELVTFYSKLGSKGKKILDNIEYEVYSASNANDYLNKIIEFSKDGCKYTAVITDSVTNLTSAAVNWSINFRTAKKTKDMGKIIPDWDEYKVETSLVSQVLDMFITLPIYTIFTCHPVASVKIEGSGTSQKVSKVNRIVSYGSKVGDIVPGRFSEIYHFSKQSDWSSGKSTTKYLVSCDAIGDDFAKSNLGLTGEMDITDKLFYEVWKEKYKSNKEVIDNALNEQSEIKTSPFDNVVSKTPIANTWKPNT